MTSFIPQEIVFKRLRFSTYKRVRRHWLENREWWCEWEKEKDEWVRAYYYQDSRRLWGLKASLSDKQNACR